MATHSNNTSNKPHRRTGEAEEESAPKGGLLTPRFAVAVVIVALVSVGAYALWRHVSDSMEQQRIADERASEQRELEAKLANRDPKVESLIDELTLEQKVAQLFVVRPESITDVGVAIAAGDATREGITKYPVGGICYFSENLQTPEQASEMLRNTQNYAKDACGIPLFLCVDEEGGTVARVANNQAFDVAQVGDMAKIGASEDPEKARDAGFAIGSYLADIGFNVDFAPVADIVSTGEGVMAQRSFGSSAELVTSMVLAQMEAFDRAGVLSCVKHFPGIGDAEGDSHDDSIYSSLSKEEMLEGPIAPFRAAVQAGVPMVMVGHLTCTGLGDDNPLPASLSPTVIDGLLRKELGYEGVVITDSLEMGAVTEVCDESEQGEYAIRAGADLVLLPKDFKKAYQGLLDAVKSGRIDEERIDDSLRRIIAAKLAINA